MTATLPSAATDGSSRKPVDRQELSTRLLGSAAKKSSDPVVDIDWAAPIPTQLYGLSPDWSTLYGTPLWDSLDREQRVTLTVHEYCSISGVGIRFECLLMQLVPRDIAGDDPALPHVQWALTEIADRVPALGDVRPDGADVRRAVLPAAVLDPAARQASPPRPAVRPPTRRSWSPRRSWTSSSAT